MLFRSLLAVASRFGSFPALLETYRECLRDVFDMAALVDVLGRVKTRTLRVTTVDSRAPSPFAASLLFNYVANYIYDGDAPLAERRAQALSVDQAQLRELLGDAELRELLDADALAAIERRLQHLDEAYKARNADAVHDLLIRIGDLGLDEIAARSTMAALPDTVEQLVHAGRIVKVVIAGTPRHIAVEDAARYRDGLGTALPSGLPPALLEAVRARLAPGGVVVQNIEPSTMLFDSATATLNSVFPSVDLYDGGGNIVAIGYEGASLRQADLLARAAKVQERYNLRYDLRTMVATRRVLQRPSEIGRAHV